MIRATHPSPREVELGLSAHRLFAALRDEHTCGLLLDGDGPFPGGWGGALVAVERAPVPLRRDCEGGALADLERRLRRRRGAGGGPDTGLAVLLGYEFGAPGPARGRHPSDPRPPDVHLLAVDAAVRFRAGEAPRLSARDRATEERARRRVSRALDLLSRDEDEPVSPGPVSSPRTSLSRDAYLGAVRRVQEHIRRGDIYQANLTQQFAVSIGEDPFALYRRLAACTPAPHSAFLEAPGWSLVSASPETFLTVSPDGAVETQPIKGTRPRAADPRADRRLGRELLASEKDRAELMMIVDLERNDLGRVCRTGSVRVPDPPLLLRSFAAVHHLVARVRGRLRSGAGPSALLRATFPGGSITGAPKIRAMRILCELEPVPRSFYTGSLLWFGDDGSVRSSILIRTIVVDGSRARVGAGGGVVADSDPEAEWDESLHKARALARALGFEPEEAR